MDRPVMSGPAASHTRQSAHAADDLPQLQRALAGLRQMRARLEALEHARHEPIAVVGLSCRFPGGARNPEAFWRLLAEGRDGITEVPPDRWNNEGLYDPDVGAPGKLNTRWGGFIDEVDMFDAAFFGITPREAAAMDPQQRLLLEVAWEALESAGTTRSALAGSAAGVFVGVHSHSSDYSLRQLRELTRVGTHTGTGTAHSIVANRLSYWLDLRGPSLAVDTACSSSLVAVHLAVQSLRSRECDLALAGGVNLMLSPEVTLAWSKLRTMAADGRCKTFDSRADGFVRGEGCGLIVLRRLTDAVAAGDPIQAVIAGSAVNQDGASNGLTAPNGLAQQDLLRAALADAGVEPSRITYVETHGTGTALGDPIEVEALAEVLGAAGEARCALGAVKTNIGHLEGAAGIAGLIKTILALRHETIPPNLHLRQLNPHIDLSGMRFELPSAALAWPAGTDRHAGVSSFGFGGTNAHIILREAPVPDDPTRRHDLEDADGLVPGVELPSSDLAGQAANDSAEGVAVAQLLPISAHTAGALTALAHQYVDFLAHSPPSLADLCYTASVRRTHHGHRLAVAGSSTAEIAGALEALLAGEGIEEAGRGHADPVTTRSLAFVFAGQGSQWAGMGRELLAQERAFREKIEACDVLIREVAGWSVIEELAAPVERSRLHATEVAQPAIFALQVALAELCRSWGIEPSAVVGHSVGEVAAAHVAGVLSLDDAVRVICLRGRLMQRAAGGGKMAAVGLSTADAQEFVAGFGGRLGVAALNGPGTTVLSGEAVAVDRAVAALEERGVFARVLALDSAYHSPEMEPVKAELTSALAGLSPNEPAIPIYSTVTGRRAAHGDHDAAYWGRNVRDPVLFAPAVAAMTADGIDDFFELGPHPLLRAPLEQCVDGGRSFVLGSLQREQPERHALLRSLGTLYVHGYPVEWRALHAAGRAVVTLPGYPWQRERYWLSDSTSGSPAAGVAIGGRERSPPAFPAGRLLDSPALKGPVYETEVSSAAMEAMGEHRLGDAALLPAAALIELLLDAGDAALGAELPVLESLVIHHPVVLAEGGSRIVHVLLQPPEDGRADCEVHTRPADDNGAWTLHATARLLAPSSAAAPPSRRGDLEKIRTRAGTGSPEPGRLARGEVIVPLGSTAPRSGAHAGDRVLGAMLDAALRVLDSAVATARGDVPRTALVVAGIGRILARGALPADPICHARPTAEDPDGGATGDIRLYGADGALVVEALDVRFAPARSETLADSSQGDADDWVHEVVWRPRGCLFHQRTRHRSDMPAPADIAARLTLRPIDQDGAPGMPDLGRDLDRLSAAFAGRALAQLGARFVPGSAIDADELATTFELPPHRRRLLSAALRMLVEDRVLAPGPGGWEVLRTLDDSDPEAAASRLASRYPEHDAELALFRRCAARLADVLRGTCDPLELLFAPGSAELTERLYRDSPLSRGGNEMVRTAVSEAAADLGPERVLRILEIGAGTGGTTAHVLPVLPERSSDYVFTDVSPSFLDRARDSFRDYPFVRFELLDIERDPEPQGFAEAQFDIVIAAHVLHATVELGPALRRARRLMAPGGLIMILEGVRPARWIDLVFGLTEGWWKFTDADLRPEHPLLDAESWADLLPVADLADARLVRIPPDGHPVIFEQALLIGRADPEPVESAAGVLAQPEPSRHTAARTDASPGEDAGRHTAGRADASPGEPAGHRDTARTALHATDPGRWLIFGEATGPGGELAAAIRARGGECMLVRSGRAADGLVGEPQLDPERPEDAASAVRRWLDADRAATGIVYLCDPAGVAAGPGSGELLARVRDDCTAVCSLARALLDDGRTPAPRLWIVTRGAQPARDAESTDPAQASLWGLGRSIALECADNWGGLIDLAAPLDASDPAESRVAPGGSRLVTSGEGCCCDPVADAAHILAQIAGDDGEDQVAFRGDDRFVPRLVRLPGPGLTNLLPSPATMRAPMREGDGSKLSNLVPEGAYLITGGLGRIGLDLSRWLGARGAGHVVLTGRSALPERSEWPALSADSPDAAKIAAIREIEAGGTAVTPVAVDVTDPEAMAALVARFGTELPPLKGVFHGAAVTGFAPLVGLDAAQIEAVLAPKVAGSWVLHRLTRNLDLDVFVLFSSVAGLWGSRGMAHYAAANQFLDALAHYRRALGLPALVVNWGGWAGGDTSRDVYRFLERSDFRLMPAAPALELLGTALAAGATQRAIAWVDWAALRASYEQQGGRPFLTEIRAATQPGVAGDSAAPGEPASALLRSLAAAPRDEAHDRLTEHVRGEVAGVMGLEPARLREPGQGFFRLGMDSLMTVELRGRLERSLGIRLPTTIAFEYPTVEALSRYLAEQVFGAQSSGAAIATRAAPESTRSAGREPREPEPAVTLADLSESELAAMLDNAVSDLMDEGSTGS